MKREYVEEYSSFVLIIEESDFPLDAETVMLEAWEQGAAHHNEDPDNPDSLVWIRLPDKGDTLCGGMIDLRNEIYFEENERLHRSRN